MASRILRVAGVCIAQNADYDCERSAGERNGYKGDCATTSRV